MAFRAFVITGFCPVMIVRSSTAASSIRPSFRASPTPMFTTTFSRRGTWFGLAKPSSCCSRVRISWLKRSFRRGVG